MAQQDNVLGAPTEGLGQTVTFDYAQDKNGVPVLNAAAPLKVQAGIQGGGVQQVAGYQGGASYQRTGVLDGIIKIAGNAAKPYIEEMKQDAFVDGMHRAMNGEAIADIAATQPWYAKLWGDGDAVEGARAYNTQSTITSMVIGIDETMPEARKLTPQEAVGFYQGELKKRLTGDQATDMAVSQAFMRQMPAMMKLQSKEHYQFQQERASVAEDKAFSTSVDQLQRWGQAFADGKINSEEFAAQKSQLVFDTSPAAGRDLESWTKTRVAGVLAAASKNQLHGISALRETGLLDAIPAHFRDDINRAVGQAETRLDAQAKSGAMDTLIDLKVRIDRGEISPAQARDMMAGQNASWAKKSGSSRPVFTDDEIVAGATGAAASVFRRQQADINASLTASKSARNEAEKYAAEIRKQVTIAGSLAAGLPVPSGATPQDVQEGWDHIRKEVGAGSTPEQAIDRLLPIYKKAWDRGDGLVDKNMANRNSIALSSAIASQDPGRITQQYAQWLKYNAADPTMATAYVGDDRLAIKMERYHMIAQGDTGANMNAFHAAFVSEWAPPTVTDKDRAAWSGTIKKELSYWVPSWMSSAGSDSGETVRRPDGSMVPIRSNGIDLKEGQAEMLLRELEPNIRARQFGDPSKAVTGALAQARSQGKLSVLGGYAVFNRGAAAGSVEQELVGRGMPPDKINDTFSTLLESKLAANGMTGTPFVVRSQGADLSFIVFAEGGQFPITGKQIEDAYRTSKHDAVKSTKPPEAHRPGFGKQVGYRGNKVVIEDGN